MLDFLDHLETERGNTVRTRNARLAAIHSFMRYAAIRDPASLPVTARVLAIPAKRFDRLRQGWRLRPRRSGGAPLPHVVDRESERGHKQPGGRPRGAKDVGRPNVAASRLMQVMRAPAARQQQRKRDGPQEVSNGDRQKRSQRHTRHV